MTPTSPQLSRRAFLVDIGRGAFAIAVIGLAGCAVGGTKRDPSTVRAEAAWHRLSLHDNFVSAYILVRSGEAAIVDVGGPDPAGSSTGDILAALEAMGLGWGNVGHVILTHYHLDHAGSAAEAWRRRPTRRVMQAPETSRTSSRRAPETTSTSSSPGRSSRQSTAKACSICGS